MPALTDRNLTILRRVRSGERPAHVARELGISRQRVEQVRALNGDASNPLYRIAALFLVMKRMGMGREAEIDEVLGSPESEKVPA